MDADAGFAGKGKPTPGDRPMNRIRIYTFSALGGIAVSFGLVAAADARPYDPMVGCWSGSSEVFDQAGASVGVFTSTGQVTWETPGSVMTFKQVTQTPTGPVTQENKFKVNGKVAEFRSADLDVTGVEINPRTYLFALNNKNTADPRFGTWYNVHYFTAKGRRLVMGGYQKGTSNDSEVENLAVQRLKRIACPRTQPSVARQQPN
jgi:hypothetical protein